MSENNKEIIPVFYSDSSQRALNVWWSEKDCTQNGPQSIVTLAKKAGLKEVYFVSPRMYDFPAALKLCEQNGLQLIFGLELWVCSNSEEHSEASIADESKVIIFMKNSEAYFDIIKLYSRVYTHIENKYYKIRGSWSILKEFWTSNLLLAIAPFDGFHARNTLNHGSSIVPDFPDKPIFLQEVNSGLPFESIINESLDNFAKSEYEVVRVKTIYYNNYEDFRAWQVYRSIHLRSNFSNPEMNFCMSNQFCLEDYLKLKS
jgi:DNA polymerase III alpha subunit